MNINNNNNLADPPLSGPPAAASERRGRPAGRAAGKLLRRVFCSDGNGIPNMSLQNTPHAACCSLHSGDRMPCVVQKHAGSP